MNDRISDDRTEVRLRRLEELVGDLGQLTDPVVRGRMRELFETLLDMHSVALARMTARLARTPEGMAALNELGADPQTRPILLLHGLHPDDLETRLRQAIASLRKDGADVSLVRLSGRSAVVRSGAPEDAEECARIEAALYEAAPDVEGVVFLGEGQAADAPVSAGAVG